MDTGHDGHASVQGHAYAILDLRVVQIPDGNGGGYKNTDMLLIRNPWGRNPWDLEPPLWYTQQLRPNKDQPWPIRPLDWSPLSSRWEANGGEFVRGLLNWHPSLDGATGKFWITIEDFLARYATVFICRLPSSFLTTFKDHWHFQNPNLSGGVLTSPTGHLNPQWKVQVIAAVPMFITLTQQSDTYENLKYIMVVLLPDDGKGMSKPLVQKDMEKTGFHFSGKPQRQQQVSIDVDMVEPGWYTLAVCTFDPGCAIEFSLSVYSNVEDCLRGFTRLNPNE